jgi:3-deoxy-D-arabino-heptulosonate 7-phosphate (DAHP) synthase
MVVTHPDPCKALSDGQQSLTLEAYRRLAAELMELAQWQTKHR